MSFPVKLLTQDKSQLGISIFPWFEYNAGSGYANGTGEQKGDIVHVVFDPKDSFIPALNYKSTKVLGVPLPPPVKIAITVIKLEGDINMKTGQIELVFDAVFDATLGPLYKAPPLQVKCSLTSEFDQIGSKPIKGKRLENKKARLVGVADVPKTHDFLVDNFLQLPTNAIADLIGVFEGLPKT